jgi:NaMN:DMB phosphoribosyltransferase
MKSNNKSLQQGLTLLVAGAALIGAATVASAVVEAIGSERKSKFNGRIPKLTVEVK